jgi:hypothetical protein
MSNVEKSLVLKLDIFWQNIFKFILWYILWYIMVYIYGIYWVFRGACQIFGTFSEVWSTDP